MKKLLAITLLLSLALSVLAQPILRSPATTNSSYTPNLGRYAILASNTTPWRVGAFGDSLGDDIMQQWVADFGRALGFNGGFLTTFTNTLSVPLTYTHSGFTTMPFATTNWWTQYFLLGSGGAAADVTFDGGYGGQYIDADTFRFVVVNSTNGGTWKCQVATNGGAFSDITGTSNSLIAGVSVTIINFNTNRGFWKSKFVNVTGTNVLIGGGIWASNKGGISPSQLFSYGGTLADVTQVPTNISQPVITALGLKEWFWHAFDPAITMTSSIPTFCSLMQVAATNVEGTFVGVNQVTDTTLSYSLGNQYIRATVPTYGYNYFDTESMGSTNDLIRRGWVDAGDCIHLSQGGIWYLSDLIWKNSGVSQLQDLLVTSRIGTHTPIRIAPAYQQTSNVFEIVDYTGTTNYFTVSKDGFVAIGPRLTGTYALDINGNMLLSKTNVSGSLAFTRLNSSSSLAHQILFDALNANTATITYERDSGRVTINSGVGIHMEIDADNNQTGNYFSVDKDAPNNTNAVNLLKVQENGGISGIAGQSTSNAFFGGTLYYSLTAIAYNTGGPQTLGTYTVPAHCITNNGDRIIAEWGGVTANTAANTNTLQLFWGGTQILSTGTQICSNTTWSASAKIIRSGIGTQHVEATISWGPGGGVPFAFTNANIEMAIDAGVAQAVAIKAASTMTAGGTNNSFVVRYEPGPK